MCGILGFTHENYTGSSRFLQVALGSLIHRGPDEQGQFTSAHVSLGAVRLSIIDLADGQQPVFSRDSDVVAVFNGEIFNHPELRAELEQEGYRFRTRCDTEVVLAAYLHWGNGCFARLRGMFAIAIWVESERKLVLARDRMGIKPLYYCLYEGQIYFGSELKCILEHPQIPRSISLEGLNCFLSLNYVPGPYTLVDGIVKLMPGNMLEFQLGHSTVSSYLQKATPVPAPRSIDEAAEALDAHMQAAVKEEVISDVPVGIWLSGGLDSSTVLHYAAQHYPQQLRTFSITFQGRSFDESKYINQVASHYGTQHLDFDLNTSTDIESAIEQMAYYSDEPSADAGALPVWFLAEMTRKHSTVILTGEGADELFGGYLTYKADRYSSFARLVPAPLRQLALGLAGSLLPVSNDKISFEYKLKRFLQGSLLSPEQAHVFWNGTFAEKEKRKIFHYADHKPLATILEGMLPGSSLQRYLDFDQRYYLADDILYKVDRMSMAHSLEVRPPFLDPRIVDFAAGLPFSFKMNGSKSKYVLRHMMRDKLPSAVLKRPKIGFDIPIHDWFRGALRPMLLDTLSEEDVTRTGLFHWPALQHYIEQHMERRANFGYHLWGLMVLSIWMKKWNINLGPLEARAAEPGFVPQEDGLLSQPLASSSSSA
jgi:asparagine synthase (glutamine-hydrolysing)